MTGRFCWILLWILQFLEVPIKAWDCWRTVTGTYIWWYQKKENVVYQRSIVWVHFSRLPEHI